MRWRAIGRRGQIASGNASRRVAACACSRDPRLLSVAERLDLGPKKSLLVVTCGERRFLVASGAETIASLLEIGRREGGRYGEVAAECGSAKTARRTPTGRWMGLGRRWVGATVSCANVRRCCPCRGLDSAISGNNAVPWNIVFTLTLLTVLPALVLSMTPMVRLLMVFHFLRQALGTQTAP